MTFLQQLQCKKPSYDRIQILTFVWLYFCYKGTFFFFFFHRCTLHPNDSLAMEGPLSRVKSLKKSLRQSFRRIRKSRVSGKKRAVVNSPTSKVSVWRSHIHALPSYRSLFVGLFTCWLLVSFKKLILSSSGEGGERSVGGAWCWGDASAETDWAPLCRRLAVWSGALPLLRRHFPQRWWGKGFQIWQSLAVQAAWLLN